MITAIVWLTESSPLYYKSVRIHIWGVAEHTPMVRNTPGICYIATCGGVDMLKPSRFSFQPLTAQWGRLTLNEEIVQNPKYSITSHILQWGERSLSVRPLRSANRSCDTHTTVHTYLTRYLFTHFWLISTKLDLLIHPMQEWAGRGHGDQGAEGKVGDKAPCDPDWIRKPRNPQ
jgi:hypothetical protein